uniref:Uncharacterized protein n=1 Tax=Salix viminalis TaxID=40686 RepID=A0A6N2N2Y0_SALVM
MPCHWLNGIHISTPKESRKVADRYEDYWCLLTGSKANTSFLHVSSATHWAKSNQNSTRDSKNNSVECLEYECSSPLIQTHLLCATPRG